jgi:catechol 2,3-dioxygenase-like lactoylglutathione lyase family enzyme
VDWKIELIAIPVTDVDRAKDFYVNKAGFNADHDRTVSDEIRFVQLTPPGSACSIALGKGVTDAAPGSAQGVQIVVADIEAAHRELKGRGVDVSDVQDFAWGRFVFFADPDGNRWAVQEIPPRSRGSGYDSWMYIQRWPSTSSAVYSRPCSVFSGSRTIRAPAAFAWAQWSSRFSTATRKPSIAHGLSYALRSVSQV